jgi:hypothetical protein
MKDRPKVAPVSPGLSGPNEEEVRNIGMSRILAVCLLRLIKQWNALALAKGSQTT